MDQSLRAWVPQHVTNPSVADARIEKRGFSSCSFGNTTEAPKIAPSITRTASSLYTTS
jgi:hypothetical protein